MEVTPLPMLSASWRNPMGMMQILPSMLSDPLLKIPWTPQKGAGDLPCCVLSGEDHLLAQFKLQPFSEFGSQINTGVVVTRKEFTFGKAVSEDCRFAR